MPSLAEMQLKSVRSELEGWRMVANEEKAARERAEGELKKRGAQRRRAARRASV